MSYEDRARKIGIRNVIKESKARVQAQKLQRNESIRTFISKFFFPSNRSPDCLRLGFSGLFKVVHEVLLIVIGGKQAVKS